MEELGDAGWARERERVAHLQKLQQLQLQQLQQQQVGYPGYGVVPPGQPQGPVLLARPGDLIPPPGCPMPVHGGMMVPAPVHVPAPWSVQWENQAQIRQGTVCHQTSWEYEDQHKAALNERRRQEQDVYFHPGSEDGHLDVRISEWKGKNCFYQGPEDYNQQDYNKVPQERDNNDFRTQEKYDKLDEDRRKRNDRVREYDHNSERYDRGRYRDMEEHDNKDKYRRRDHYDRKYNERYESREQQYYDSRKHHKPDLRERDSYNSEYEDSYDYKDTYSRRDNYRDGGHYYDHDRHNYDSSPRYREKERYQRRDEDRYDERKRKDYYPDRRAEDRYDHREHTYKDRDDYYESSEETCTKRRGQYDSDQDKQWAYKERDHYSRFNDTGDDRRDEDYDYRRRDHHKARDHYGRRMEDHYDQEYQNRREMREGEHSPHKLRDRFQDLRSLSVDAPYEEYPKKVHKTHCEEWVEQQNQKLALREMHSFEDPVVYRHRDEQEKGYESSTSTSSKRGRKTVYVGSLDRNSFYRKTAPSSLRKAQFATTRKQNQGKHIDKSCEGIPSVCVALNQLCRAFRALYTSSLIIKGSGTTLQTNGSKMLLTNPVEKNKAE